MASIIQGHQGGAEKCNEVSGTIRDSMQGEKNWRCKAKPRTDKKQMQNEFIRRVEFGGTRPRAYCATDQQIHDISCPSVQKKYSQSIQHFLMGSSI